MLETIKLILQLVPIILELVKAIEAQIPEGGQGKAKLDFIQTVLTQAYPQIVDIWGMVEKIVSSAVTLYNATRSFQKIIVV